MATFVKLRDKGAWLIKPSHLSWKVSLFRYDFSKKVAYVSNFISAITNIFSPESVSMASVYYSHDTMVHLSLKYHYQL